MAALEAAAYGFEILYATKRYQRVLVNEGLEGIRRIVAENRERDLRRWAKDAKRAKLIQAKRVGERLHITLTEKGHISLLKRRIEASPRLPDRAIILVSFDFPISQRGARERFRYFLRTNGFKKLQQSLWSTRRDVTEPLKDLIKRSGTGDWIRIFRVIG